MAARLTRLGGTVLFVDRFRSDLRFYPAGMDTHHSVRTTNAWSDALKDPRSEQAVIGRIAFAVYEIWGLLDINITGHPGAPAGLADVRQKGRLAWADLNEIPSISDNDALIAWRNAATAIPATALSRICAGIWRDERIPEGQFGRPHLHQPSGSDPICQANPSVLEPTPCLI